MNYCAHLYPKREKEGYIRFMIERDRAVDAREIEKQKEYMRKMREANDAHFAEAELAAARSC